MAIAKERLSGGAFMPKWVWHEHLARYEFAAGYVRGKSVIDCACGDGIGSEHFFNAGASSIRAFDLSEQAVAAAKARNEKTSIVFQVGSALKLPVADHSADIYISLETIEHVDQDRAFLNEIVRVLKRDGLFICSTPNRSITNPGKTLADKPWNRFHVREYSQAEFVALLAEKFGEIELFGQNPNWAVKADTIGFFGKILPFHGAVRMNQMLKLPGLLFDRKESHSVQKLDAGQSYEYIVAVCREPKS